MEVSEETKRRIFREFNSTYKSKATVVRREIKTAGGSGKIKEGIAVAPREGAKYIEPQNLSEQPEQEAAEAENLISQTGADKPEE